MSIVFHETLFDPLMIRTSTGESYPATGTLEFANTILTNPLTGAQKVNVNRLTALRKINILVKLAKPEDSAYLQNFFMGGFGAIPFRFRYVPDYTATLEKFGTSNGVLTQFYLKKTFIRPGITSHESVWRITKPVVQAAKETNSFQLLEADGVTPRVPTTPLKIYRNNVEITSGWTVDCKTGIVYFTSAPAAGTLSWSGEFDIPVRFVGNITHGFGVPSEVDGITLQELAPYELGIT